MDSGWPEVVENFERFLERSGFTLLQRFIDVRHFGNRIVEYISPEFKVRVVLDRGVWDAEIADTTQSNEWYFPATLRQLLHGSGEDAIPIQEQLAFLEKNWDTIVDRFSPAKRDKTHAELAELNRARVKRMFPGLDPDAHRKF